MIKSTGG